MIRATWRMLLLMAVAATSGSQELHWPQPALPRDAQASSPGEHIAVNGMPLRIVRFQTGASLEELTRLFRESIDSGFVQREGAAFGASGITLGGRRDDYWLTLQVAPGPRGMQATWSAAPRFVAGITRETRRPPGFPDSAELLQQVDSMDAGRRSQFAIGREQAPVDAVAQRLEQDLRREGYRRQPFPPRKWSPDGQYSAVFGGTHDEIVVALRPEDGGTVITINRLSALEQLP